MTKLERLRALSEQLSQSETNVLEWEWYSFISFEESLVAEGIFKRHPPTRTHLKELMRIAMGHPMKTPRSIAARWAKRTAIQLSQEHIRPERVAS